MKQQYAHVFYMKGSECIHDEIFDVIQYGFVPQGAFKIQYRDKDNREIIRNGYYFHNTLVKIVVTELP